MIKFETNKTYKDMYGYTFKVVSRTAKTITTLSQGKTKRFKLKDLSNKYEVISSGCIFLDARC